MQLLPDTTSNGKFINAGSFTPVAAARADLDRLVRYVCRGCRMTVPKVRRGRPGPNTRQGFRGTPGRRKR